MRRKIFEVVKRCDLCGSTSAKNFIKSPDRNYKTGEFTYVKCNKCGLVWLSPRPTQKALSKFYPKIYKAHLKIIKPPPLVLTARNIIYRNQLLAKFLIKDQLFFWKEKGKILDVGTGNGRYLEVLRGWGWDSFGLEISESIVKEAKKNGVKNIKHGVLVTSKFSNSYFNAIRFSHVMEHVPSPKKELYKTYDLLKKGGKVIILIPNIDSLFFRIFRSYWYPLDPPRHFYHYSPWIITRYLKESGFRDIEINYQQSPYTFIRSLQYRLKNGSQEKRYGVLVYPLSFLMRILDLLKLSDVLEVVAAK